MNALPEAVQKAFQEIKSVEKRHIELKIIHNDYYVYRATSKWDRQKHKPTKTTVFLGTITPDGQYKPKQPQKREKTNAAIYEYGNSQLCQTLSKDIQDALKENKYQTKYKDELLALSITRAIDPVPLRLVQSRWSKLYASKNQQVNLTSRHLSDVLAELGNNPQIYDLYAKLAQEGGMLFYDLTAVLSYSKNLKLAEKGYNSNHEYENQINIIMAFSTTTHLPVAVDVECTERTLEVALSDGRMLSVPLVWFPRLLVATPEQRRDWQLVARGKAIAWAEVGEDISVEGLLLSA